MSLMGPTMGATQVAYLLCCTALIISLHLSAYSQYSRHEASLSGGAHSAPQSRQTPVSSSLQISTEPPQAWHLTYLMVGLRRSLMPGQASALVGVGRRLRLTAGSP